jgi:hypothetical protein
MSRPCARWLVAVAFLSCSGVPTNEVDGGAVDAGDEPVAPSTSPGTDTFSIPRDAWAEFDVGRNDGPLPSEARLRVIKAPTRGVAVVGSRLIRYRSDWHVFGSDRLTYGWFVNDEEVARHEVAIEVRNERWLSVGRPFRLHLDVGGAPLETDRSTDWVSSLTDVADDGASFCGRTTRGQVGEAFRLDGPARTTLAVDQHLTRPFRFSGQDVLAEVVSGSTTTARFDATGRVAETWAAPDAGTTWVLGAYSTGVLARLETGSTTAAGVLSRSQGGLTMREIDLDGGAPMAVSDGFIAGMSAGSPRRAFVLQPDGGLLSFAPAMALDFTVDDVDAVQGVVGSSQRARFSEGYLRAMDGTMTTFSIATMLETRPRGLSRRGDVVGEVLDLGGRRRTFWLEPVIDPAVAALAITPVAEPRNAGIDHACFHAEEGPFAMVTGEAMPQLAARAPITSGHVMYTVDVRQRGPHLAIQAMAPREVVSFFLETRDVLVRLSDEEGRALQPTFIERTDRCPGLRVLVQARTPERGPLFIEFDSTESSVKFVFERSWVYSLEGQ